MIALESFKKFLYVFFKQLFNDRTRESNIKIYINTEKSDSQLPIEWREIYIYYMFYIYIYF